MTAPVPSAGLGLKAEHYEAALASPADGLWFEVHAENYMIDGGPRLAWLDTIRSQRPVALHGVALSLAADAVPDAEHLRRLSRLVDRVEPFIVSEHLAWSSWRGSYLPDLLPFPRTAQALARICDNIGRVQDRLRRRIAIENPTHYLRLEGHAYEEADFLAEIARRSGCGLLLDLNNIHVSAHNLGVSARACIEAFPLGCVDEIHLAGHSADPALGDRLLIDSHDQPVGEDVWSLFFHALTLGGARPTLIERDGNIPAFSELLRERERANDMIRNCQVRAA